MQGITSHQGGSSITPKIPLTSYLSSTTQIIRLLFDSKSTRTFTDLIKFLQKAPIPVAILSYDMESTSGDLILNTFSSCITSHGLHFLILRLTSKSSTKKQILQQLQSALQISDPVIYIECFEEWPQDLLCFIFEYLIDQPQKVSFVLDITTDPRYLSQVLDASILQKITVDQFFFPEFNKITAEVLWNLTQTCNFPILSAKIFLALAECRSEAKFMKILKSSLLKFFNERPDRQKIFLDKEGLDEFIVVKDQWVELLQLFQRIIETPPLDFAISIEDLHKQIYLKGTECRAVEDFIGRLQLKDFETFSAIDEFVVSLCERNIITEEDVTQLRNDFLNLHALGSSPKEVEISKCKKWKLSFFLPKLRFRIIGNLIPLDEASKKLKNSDLYVLNICDFIDSDLMRLTLQQLNFCDFGFNCDLQILFKIIKGKGRHIELNRIFDEFTQRCSVNDGLENLQSRFLNTCNYLWMMGLLKQSKKKKKADTYFVEKNFFGRSTFYN